MKELLNHAEAAAESQSSVGEVGRTAPTRRLLLKGAGWAAGAKLAGSVSLRGGEKELLDLCEQFRRLERTSRDMWKYDDHEFWRTLFERQQTLVGRIITMRPRTLEDFRAISRAVTGWVPGAPPHDLDDLCGTDGELLSFLLGSLVEVAPR